MRADSATTRAVPSAGVEGAPAAVAVGGQGQAPAASSDAGQPGAFSRSRAASPPGPTTVLRNSWWSYWRYTHDGSIEQGQQVGAAVVGRRPAAPGRRPGRASRSAGAASGPVVARGVVVQAGGGHVGQHLAVPAVEDPQPAAVPVTLPTTVARTSQRAQMRQDLGRGRSGVTMASMRSWLSLVMTSKGSMPGSRSGTAGHVDVHADPALRRRLAGRAR